MTGGVSIIGRGVGSLTCASILAGRGWEVALDDDAGQAAWPVLVLNEVTLTLLGELWGPDVWSASHPVTRRRVRWGPAADEVVMPVTSVVLDGRFLVERLLGRVSVGERLRAPPTWAIVGTKRSPRLGRRETFGRRCVIQAQGTLVGKETSTTWVETVEGGWVHLAPMGAGLAVVQCMVATPPVDPAELLDRMIGATAAIGERLGRPLGAVTVLPAAPALSEPACGPGWIAVSDAAVRLDPISGLGTAWSLRSGVLAAAVVDGIASGLPAGDCLRHYDQRLRLGLFEHVDHCLRLYGTAFATPEWRSEIDAMTRTSGERRRLPPEPSFSLRLDGLRLKPEPEAIAGGR